jgi:Flp pilus assembly protein TadD
MGYQARPATLRAAFQHLQADRFLATADLAGPLARRDPHDAEACLLLGLAIGAQGDTAGAAVLLNAVAALRPMHAHPARDLACILNRLGRPDAAEAQYRACLAVTPQDPKLAYALAEHLHDAGRAGEAVELLAHLLAETGDFAPGHNLLGMILADLGQTEAAIGRLRRAIAIDPNSAAPWSNLGMLLKTGGQFDEALAAYDRALAVAPGDAQIRVNRSVALLRAGRLAEAWGDYEYRLRLPGHTSLPLERLLPAVDGLALAGRTVLATHEEGFGDTLHFARYLPLLAARGARVIAAVPRPLARIVASIPGVARVVSGDEALPAFDWHCPFFSLPRAFATTIETIPAPIPYIAADPADIARFAASLPPAPRRIGLCWAGQARPWLPGFTILDARRSAGLAAFAPLAALPGVQFVSLQKGDAAAEPPPPGLALHDPMAAVADFADTAAIIANLDLVISVDTSVVHLAGALGTPVFLLDRYDGCWRWFSGRDDSPWYPKLRIFRQAQLGDWATVMARVAQAL